MEKPTPFTWRKIKEFINNIPEKYLDKTAVLLFQDDEKAVELLEPFYSENDIWVNKEKFKSLV